ncbi:bifunctional 4-hydroxy-2-oxoglutarate aldolase/2-dehydro-3-deoxy-phosphogluconate aldolase [Synechococcus sp. L2F]|nr:bifunctional 4-hydroxy-2-oxoglutarate aldolase/2-dehydro-3-deoxy-phosphogluconate aldolase [Synechococcus sp. L2F]
MCGSPSTSEPASALQLLSGAADWGPATGGLISSLREQPLLTVVRCAEAAALHWQVQQLASAGVRHVEVAWSPQSGWVEQCQALQRQFPGLLLGAASITTAAALADVRAAGLSYAMSPLLCPELLAEAARLDLLLVPGVMSPTEVNLARRLGCGLVKLFPAAALGPGYWRLLAGPLAPLPFCIAAGGLRPADVPVWLAAGVQAVTLGSALFTAGPEAALDPQLALLLQALKLASAAASAKNADDPDSPANTGPWLPFSQA